MNVLIHSVVGVVLKVLIYSDKGVAVLVIV